MIKPMTPSEIADWLEGLASSQRAAAQAAALANIRGRGQEHLESLAKGCERAAATIRAQAEALKIATEALVQSDLKIRSPLNTDQSDVEFIRQALARMKEAGQ